jgi:hypothetical protein
MNDGAQFTASGAPAASPHRQSVGVGDRSGLMGLLLKNQLLTLVTLGFYRFWARTELRRFLWSRVFIDGDALEYTGQGGELCRGFLKALVMLVPFFVFFGVVEAFLDPGTVGFVVEKVVYFTVVLGLIAVAQFHARRYRLSRSLWRGIRFAQTGSALEYTRLTLGWALATVLTLGVAFPWLRWAQYEYLMRHTAFGSTFFTFAGSPRVLLAPWLLVLVSGATPALALGALALQTESLDALDLGARLGLAPWVPGVALLVSLPLLALAVVNFRVREFRAVAAATRLGLVAVESVARSRRVLALVAGYAIAVAAILVPVAIVVAVVLPSVLSTSGPLSIAAVAAVVVLVGYLVLGSLWTFIVSFGALRHFVATMRIHDVDCLATVVQGSHAVPLTGEGLADSFDVG